MENKMLSEEEWREIYKKIEWPGYILTESEAKNGQIKQEEEALNHMARATLKPIEEVRRAFATFIKAMNSYVNKNKEKKK